MTGTFTANDVVGFLDRYMVENPTWQFIDLAHPHVYTANSRLTLYANETQWAIVSEVSGFNQRAYRFYLTLTFLGNCLERLKRVSHQNRHTYNIDVITLIEQFALLGAVEHFAKSAAPVDIDVRDRSVQVPAQVSTFVPKVHAGSWPKGAEPQDLGRYIAYEYADLCRATDAEKRAHLPANLPELMTIDQWHHRKWSYVHGAERPEPTGTAPSSYETYRLVAEVLATRDPSRYRPTLPPNNHWSNWPAAGSL